MLSAIGKQALNRFLNVFQIAKKNYKCQVSFSAANHKYLVGVFRLIQKNIRVMDKKNKYEEEDFFAIREKQV